MGSDVQLDRVYRLFPTGTGPSVNVWAGHSFASGLATVGQQIDQGGKLYAPLSTVVVRVRWRPDVTTESRLIDGDGRLWRVNETLEVGRRRWLDVSVSTYDLPAPSVVAWPEGQQPAGWRVQWRTGAGARGVPIPPRYVAEVVIGESFAADGLRVFRALIPAPGWAVAGADTWMDPRAVIAVAGPAGVTGFGLLPSLDRETVARVDANNLRSGSLFPTVPGAAFFAQGTGFQTPELPVGATLTISGRV